ncbi:MAG TPA: NrdH-redoxin [Candidatus Aminicenantes bacterium]|nr:NrdH-redoxin [Candidatus Aminicenantes bacterium]
MNQTPKVVVFTTPTCSWCRAVKSHLRKLNIRFREVDISRDPAAARDMVRRTGQQGVPVTLVNNQPVVGFDQSKLERLLGVRR